MNTILSISHLTVQYKKKDPVLANFNLDAGEFQATALLGPNAAGKSTLISVLAGLIPHYKGRLLFRNESWAEDTLREVAFVFDRPSFPPLMNASQTLKLFQGFYGMRNSPAEVGSLLETVGLQSERKPYLQYSQGMKQRLAVAAALVKRPRLLILDEGLTFIDQTNKTRIIEHFRQQIRNQKLSVLFATHSQEECDALADRVVNLNQRPACSKI